jgi:hypothetical protein
MAKKSSITEILPMISRREFRPRIYGHTSQESHLTSVPHVPHDSLPEVTLREDQMVTGHFLREIRKERGIELVDISNRAKISISYLRAIEQEKFDELPPPVYIRGFVTEYAKYLKIDPNRAVSDFMATMEAVESKKKQQRARH